MNKSRGFSKLWFLLVLLVSFMAGCGEHNQPGAQSSANSVSAFSLNGSTGVVDEGARTIAVTRPSGLSVTGLVATFTTSGATTTVGTATQVSGTTANDFTSPVAYTVTAGDGSQATYAVSVNVATVSSKEITAFSLAGVPGTVNEAGKAVAVSVPNGTNLATLVATFVTTGSSVKVGTVLQKSGTTPNNFSFPVTYIVTAADGTPVNYLVTVSTLAAKGPAPVLLGSAGNYVILAKTAISTVPPSAIVGDIGLSPAATSYLTGFDYTLAGTYATSPQVTGKMFASTMDAPTGSLLTVAVSDMETAYTDAAGRTLNPIVNAGAGELGGLTLIPGLYSFSTAVTVSADVTLSGGPNDVWILQIPQTLSVSSAKHVFLSGGARPGNVFWQVAGGATIGTGAQFKGIILSQTSIILRTGASLTGRALAQSAVNLDTNAVKAN